MLTRLTVIALLASGASQAGVITLTIGLTAGTFVSQPNPTETFFTTGTATCAGVGCVDIIATLANLNGQTLAFTVNLNDLTGASAVPTGTIIATSLLNGFAFQGQVGSCCVNGGSFTENITMTQILGVNFTPGGINQLLVSWSGNPNSGTAKASTGTITINGNLVPSNGVPEPATTSLFALAAVGLTALKFRRRRS